MNGLLVFFHTPINVGFAIAPLERTFFEMARRLLNGDLTRVHFAYKDLNAGRAKTLPPDFSNVVALDAASQRREDGHRLENYIREHAIDVAFGFDQPPRQFMYQYLRRGGVKHFLSYWGAPMSSLNRPPKLWLKQLEVSLLGRNGPDHYIFESHGMADAAVRGRGVARKCTSVVHLGVDVRRFSPNRSQADYVYRTLGVDASRKVFIYAGHMEERKGVHVLLQAARVLIDEQRRDDFHLLILGNREGEAELLLKPLDGARALEHITFGGYRDDMPALLNGCYAGLIASTGWDSFPRTAIEIAAAGLPLIVSDLPGLNETVERDRTGFVFPVGDAQALAAQISRLLDAPDLRERMGAMARTRALREFTLEHQMEQLVGIVTKVSGVQAR